VCQSKWKGEELGRGRKRREDGRGKEERGEGGKSVPSVKLVNIAPYEAIWKLWRSKITIWEKDLHVGT
jgi:hypothetical protein